MMNRRRFSVLAAAGAASAAVSPSWADTSPAEPFKSLFAPHPNQLPTGPKDYLDQLRFAHELGFRAWEDNRLIKQPAKLQEQVGALCGELGMTLGVTVISGGNGQHFPTADEAGVESVLANMRKGVETAKRTGQTHMTMIPGIRREGEDLARQIEGAVDLMKRCCDIVEEHGIILVQEPLSHGVGGGAPLLRSFEDGHRLCSLVNRKSCKLLADYFHEGQIGNGDKLIENSEKAWDQIAYVQYGDSPGRKEPGTGKLDYVKVTRWLREKGYTGVIGMEHGASRKGKKGLKALLDAYRKVDA